MVAMVCEVEYMIHGNLNLFVVQTRSLSHGYQSQNHMYARYRGEQLDLLTKAQRPMTQRTNLTMASTQPRTWRASWVPAASAWPS
jgi:hypothetical protein